MHHAIDLNGGHGGALQRGQQHPTQGVAERDAKAALERFGDDAGAARAIGARLDQGLFRADQFIPVTFNHGWISLGAGSSAS